VKVVISGAGAAGVATARILRAAGVEQIVCCDRQGALYAGRTEAMNSVKAQLAEETNPRRERGTLSEVLRGADVFIGLSSPNLLTVADIQRMAARPVVFALANPVPEIQPEDAVDVVGVMATGRSDYPNQINNALAFPGIFRGALDCQARCINEAMKTAAAQAIANVIGEDELHPEYIVPSIFNRRVVAAVAEAVAETAYATGVAKRRRPTAPDEAASAGVSLGLP
jgi:malate dehydrogenase (oxaloacetate-decarboxylating)